MRFFFLSALILLLSTTATLATPPSPPAPSPARPSVPEEASWLAYYRFLSSHPVLSGDALLPALAAGRRIRHEAASAALADSIAARPEQEMRDLDAALDATARDGLDARAAFGLVLAALRSRALDADAPSRHLLESSADALAARLESAPDADPASAVSSGYLAWLAARCGAEGDTPDAEYLRTFPDAPWSLGLLKFRGDLHYFARGFDKAIDLYRRAIAKGDPSPTSATDRSSGANLDMRASEVAGAKGAPDGIAQAADRYSPFFESEVRRRIGQCHLVCDRFDSAAVELTRAASLSAPPESAVNRLLAAHGLIRAKSPDAALPLLQTALREGGGDGAPLPDAIVNSLKVQEALAWRAKGDPKKILALLSDLAQSPDPAFLFPSDRKMTWLLMASGYRAAGEEENAAEAVKRAESEPPLSPAQKLDPMNERYEAFVEKTAFGLERIAFFVEPDTYYDRLVLEGLADVPARLKLKIFGTTSSGTVLPGCEIAGEDLSAIGGNEFDVEIRGGPGKHPIQVTATDPESGISVTGVIERFLVQLRLSEVKVPGASLLVHFEDRNLNGKLDNGERLSDGSPDPTSLDTAKDTDLAYAQVHWTAEGMRVPCRLWKGSSPSFHLVLREWPEDDVLEDISFIYRITASQSCSTGTSAFQEIRFDPGDSAGMHKLSLGQTVGSGLTDRIVSKEETITWKCFARYGALPVAELALGTSVHTFLVTAASDLFQPYMCLIDHALKIAGRLPADRTGIPELLASLPELRNDLGAPLVFSPMKEETAQFGATSNVSTDLKMQVGRFLDAGRGNSTAWAKAFATMAGALGYEADVRTMEWTNKWGLPLESPMEIVTAIGGNHQGVPETAAFNIWQKGFPGVPHEKRGDFTRDEPKNWMPLADHSIVLIRNGAKFDLADPTFSEQPWAYQEGLFVAAPGELPVSENSRFAVDYFLKLAPNSRFLGVPCHSMDGGIKRFDLTTNSVLLMSRPLMITFNFGAKPEDRNRKGSAEPAAEDSTAPRVGAIPAADAPEELISRKRKEPLRREKRSGEHRAPGSEELNDFNAITKKADEGNPAASRAALQMCKDFLDKYPVSDFRTFLGYLFARMLTLGVAIPEFETRYHIPGWWHQDKDYQDLKKELFSSANRAHMKWLAETAAASGDVVTFDTIADAALLLGRYSQMAGEHEQAIAYLKDALNPYYKNHAPYALAALGETLSNYANEKPEKRNEAIDRRVEYVNAYGDRPDLEPLTVNVIYALAADLVFEKRYQEAENVLGLYVDNLKDDPYTPGLNIMLAHVLAVKDSPNYKRAEEILTKLAGSTGGPAIAANGDAMNLGFKPWARLVLARLYMRKGEPLKTIDLANKFEREWLDRADTAEVKADEGSTAFFYDVWSRSQLAGVIAQKALALNQLGRFDEAIATASSVPTQFPDDKAWQKAKPGVPFPRMVHPVWGDDNGSWIDLGHQWTKRSKTERTLKPRVVEFPSIRMKFVNPFKTDALFTKAIALWNRNGRDGADRKEALYLFNQLANVKPTRDFMSTTVVGADPYLIAISPQTFEDDPARQFARDMLEGRILADFKVFVDDEKTEYDPEKVPLFGVGTKHKLIIQGIGLDNPEIPPSPPTPPNPPPLPVKRPVKSKSKATPFPPDRFNVFIDGKPISGNAYELSVTNDPGEKLVSIGIRSNSGLLVFSERPIKYVNFKIDIIAPSDRNYPDANSIEDIKANNNYKDYAYEFVDTQNGTECVILCKINILPNTDVLRERFKDNIYVKFEELFIDPQVKSELTYDNQINVGSDKYGFLKYDVYNGYWHVMAKYTGLPAPPEFSYGRVPYKMKELLYGKKTVVFKTYNIDKFYTPTSKYELFFGNNFRISDVIISYITKNITIINNLFNDTDNTRQSIKHEIYSKMCCSEILYNFSSFVNISKNLMSRIFIIENMDKISKYYNSGNFVDFFGTYDPTNIDLNKLNYNAKHVIIDVSYITFNACIGNTYYNEKSNSWNYGNFWKPQDINSPTNTYYYTVNGVSLHESVKELNAIPLSTECRGAAQYCFYNSICKVIDSEEFNNANKRLVIGALDDMNYDKYLDFYNFDYKNYNYNFIPGDWVYMKNHDYIASDGPWSGENCIYVGYNTQFQHGIFNGLACFNTSEVALRSILVTQYELKYHKPVPEPHLNVRFINNYMINIKENQ